jgi:fumarylacetoacetate (FAA) hydrolase
MKFATLDNKTRDGTLIVVSRDLTRFARPSTPTTLQKVLDEDQFDQFKPLYDQLNSDVNFGEKLDVNQLLSPLPRAYEWIDGSAYINHIVLVRKARNAPLPPTLKTDPLVYQGGSGVFLRPTENIEHYSTDYGIDFESEIAVVTTDVPMGTKAADAAKYIRLFMLVNDVSLRNLIPQELEKGFGFFVSKPSSAFSPIAITPDELSSEEWKDGRVHLPLITFYNGKLFGNPNAGPEMFFSFFDLIQHATKTRALTAGTIIGSGTVSNEDRSKGSSCLAEKRMIELIETGKIISPFMQFGDTVEIYMQNSKGEDLFGHIKQTVAQKK